MVEFKIERFFIMVNLTFNDETQMKILEFLGTTEKMIADITSKLSNSKKEAKIYAMSDLGLYQ